MPNDRINVFIDKHKFELADPVQTGRALKELAGIPLKDALFLDQPGDDLVIANDAQMTLRNGAHLHSEPSAEYGDGPRYAEMVETRQADGWRFVTYRDFRIPAEFRPDRVDVLVKLPPTFPDAAPDMFWVTPSLTISATGAAPRGTSAETILGGVYQRFSWHLKPGAWRPGVSTLADYIRCIIGRFERRD